MALEAVILICDRGDGRPATESLRFKLGERNMQLDLCAQHVQELARAAHPVRRGRQRKTTSKDTATAKRTASKKTGAAKRRGRPPGSKNKPKS